MKWKTISTSKLSIDVTYFPLLQVVLLLRNEMKEDLKVRTKHWCSILPPVPAVGAPVIGAAPGTPVAPVGLVVGLAPVRPPIGLSPVPAIWIWRFKLIFPFFSAVPEPESLKFWEFWNTSATRNQEGLLIRLENIFLSRATASKYFRIYWFSKTVALFRFCFSNLSYRFPTLFCFR